MVTLADVQDQIREAINRGARASDKNAANFLYDIIRNPNANEMWPRSVFEAGYTGRQLVGTGQCFEFVKLPQSATEPFPNVFKWTEETKKTEVQSLSLPLLVRELGPNDEMAVLQFTITLRLLETHFALRSTSNVAELILLQTSAHFSNVVIDGLFAASLVTQQGIQKALVTCEAKQQDQRILEDRIIRQVQAAANMPLRPDWIIATVAQRAPDCSIYILEFEPVPVSRAKRLESLTPASSALYLLRPKLTGF